MQKRLLTLLVLLVALQFNSQAQVPVEQTQRSIISKITATWCPNCGNWGWPFFEDLIEDNEDKAIALGVHYSGDLESDVAIDLTNNFNASGQPQFYLNNINTGASSNNVSDKLSEITNNINNNATLQPMANVGIDAVYTSDNEIIVYTNTKFFQSASGRYTLGLYVVEDQVMANQAGQGSDAMHPKVLRASIGDSFGAELFNGNTTAGTEFPGYYTMAIDSDWNLGDLSIVGIIWQDINNTSIFVNAFEDTEVTQATSNKNIVEDQINLNVVPNIINDVATINLTISQSINDANIQIFDMTGRLVNTVFEGDLANGTHNFEINKSKVPSNGMYLVQLQSNKGTTTQQVIFQ